MDFPSSAWIVVIQGNRHILLENVGGPRRIDLRTRGPEGCEAQRCDRAEWRDNDAAYPLARLAQTLNAAASRSSYPAMAIVADRSIRHELRQKLGDGALDLLTLELDGIGFDGEIGDLEARVAAA